MIEYMAWQAELTWAGTFEDLYPYPDSMIGMQPMLFRILNQSSMPSCAFLGERSSFAVSCKWSNQPIARPRWIRRRRYGKWIQEFFGLGRSKIEMNRNFQWLKCCSIIAFYSTNLIKLSCIVDRSTHTIFISNRQIAKHRFEKKKRNTNRKWENYPFLAIRISQIVDGFRIPWFSDAKQFAGQESIFSHDHEVHKESSSCLNHTNLSICHRNQSARFIKITHSYSHRPKVKKENGKEKKRKTKAKHSLR